MTANLRYQRSKELGISDEDIIEQFSKKDPTFKARYDRSLELGKKPEEIFSMAFDYYQRKKEAEQKPEPEEESGAADYLEEFGKQTAQGFGIGALGTYGDILEMLGVPTEELPSQKAKSEREFGTLEKLEKGEVPSLGELTELGDTDILPSYSRLPSSADVEELGGKLGLVSEPKTAAGRYGRRIGKLGGSGLATGFTGIKAPIIAGAAGQTLEELGAPAWMQAAAEIVATLKYAPKSNVPVTSRSKNVEQTIQDLRKAGYSEQDITLAKNALEERKILKKYATLTPEAENAINAGIKNSEELFKEQIKKGLPGYEKGGLGFLEKQASNVYQTMEDLASSVKVTNKEPVRKAINDAISTLEKYPLLDEQKKFIEFMKDGLAKLDTADTAEFFTGFYRNLGRAGNWGDPKQKERLLGMVRQGIKDTFAESGKEGAKFGKYFEATNETWKHWLDTKDLMQTIEKAATVEGVNFKKLSSMLTDPETYELAKKVLGPEQLNNIKIISEGAQSIESLLKQIPKADKGATTLKLLEGIRAIFTGDKKFLATLIGIEAAKRISTQMLIDPKKQNLMKKIIVAAKNNAPQQAAILAQELFTKASSPAKEKEQSRK